MNPRLLGGKWFEGDAVAESLELSDGSLAGAVGYFKASNTGANDRFGGSVALSAASNTT